jgi:hypothetical protein
MAGVNEIMKNQADKFQSLYCLGWAGGFWWAKVRKIKKILLYLGR